MKIIGSDLDHTKDQDHLFDLDLSDQDQWSFYKSGRLGKRSNWVMLYNFYYCEIYKNSNFGGLWGHGDL